MYRGGIRLLVCLPPRHRIDLSPPLTSTIRRMRTYTIAQIYICRTVYSMILIAERTNANRETLDRVNKFASIFSPCNYPAQKPRNYKVP